MELGTRDWHWYTCMPYLCRFIALKIISLSSDFAVVPYLTIVFLLLAILVMCSVSTNGERAGLANSKLTIDSLLECS